MKKIVRVDITEIDLENRFFKISKEKNNDELVKSIDLLGLVDLPVLLKSEKYIVISGFARIESLVTLKIKSVEVIVVEDLNVDQFLQLVHLKIFNGKVSPAGKFKVLQILRDHFFYDFEKHFKFLRNTLTIPDEFIKNKNLLDDFYALPTHLVKYFEQREINFKLILSILNLSSNSKKSVSHWIDEIKIKNNILKTIVDMISEIERRDGTFPKIDVDSSIENYDKILHEKVYKIRYPQFSEKKREVLDKISVFEKSGLKVNFPDYFEGGKFELILQITKKNGVSETEKQLKNLDLKKVDSLLDYL